MNDEAKNSDETDDKPEDRFWLWDDDVLEEEEHVDIRNDDKAVDDYWAKGWLSGYTRFQRFNYDAYDDLYYKVFPTRFRLRDFVLTKSLRRLLRKNEDLQTIIRPLRITEGKSKLHCDYHIRRHGSEKPDNLSDSYQYIKYYPSELNELCVFKDDKLAACSIFEVGEQAMFGRSAFWNVDETARGLGVLTVLLEMLHGRKLNLDYYYLGHYFKQNPNYQYKTRFRGLELYDWDNERWVDFKDSSIESMLAQKLPRIRY